MNAPTLRLLASLALVPALLPGIAAAAALVPPPGYYAEVRETGGEGRPCPDAQAPYTGTLEFPSKYEGSDGARDDLNEKAYDKYKQLTRPITETERQVSALVGSYLRTGNPQTLACVLDWLDRWAQAGAMTQATRDHTGKSMRKWALGSLASAWLRLKFSSSRPLKAAPDKVRRIETWFGELARLVVNDWKDQPLDRVNNHEYWAAWAVMATAVALDRRDLFDWAIAQYRIAASQVDDDGYLPNELRRDTRALAYHNYALGPLTMIAAFARANGVDVTGENDRALQRLARRVLAGIDDPKMFKERTGKKQNLDDVREPSKFSWLEPYCWTVGCDGPLTQRLAQLRPLKTHRLGGNVTELFGPPGAGEADGKDTPAGHSINSGAGRRARLRTAGDPSVILQGGFFTWT